MHYFLSHIVYIIIAGVLLGLLAFATVVLAGRNEANRDINEEKCSFHRGSCPNTDSATRKGKRV
ncbi:MAG: hypothetical protein ACLVC5_09175 [Clostridia bacterium]